MCTRPARIQADSLVSSSSHSRGCCWCVGQVNTSLRGCGRSLHTFTPSKLCNLRWSERGIAHGVATDYTSMHASAQCIRSMAHVSPTHLPHTQWTLRRYKSHSNVSQLVSHCTRLPHSLAKQSHTRRRGHTTHCCEDTSSTNPHNFIDIATQHTAVLTITHIRLPHIHSNPCISHVSVFHTLHSTTHQHDTRESRLTNQRRVTHITRQSSFK